MKNAASCVTWCELQDTLSTDFSNAHCSLGFHPGLRLSEGRKMHAEGLWTCLVAPGERLRPHVPPTQERVPEPDDQSVASRPRLEDEVKSPETWRRTSQTPKGGLRPRVFGGFDERPGTAGSTTLPPNRGREAEHRKAKNFSKLSTSDQARRPAEFKHINKRRKRNQQGFPQ